MRTSTRPPFLPIVELALAALLGASLAAPALADEEGPKKIDLAFAEVVSMRAEIQRARQSLAAALAEGATEEDPEVAALAERTAALETRFEAMASTLADDLIALLEDERWEVREEASRRLEALLPHSIDALLRAARVPDGAESAVETVQRARRILRLRGIGPDGLVRQWAQAATASTEYSDDSWSALQATGEPDTPVAGDQPTAWATRDPDGGAEHLDLVFRTAVFGARVAIHETFNPGAVVRVEGHAEDGRVFELWSGADPTRGDMGVLDVALAATPAPVRRLRIVLDTSAVAGWNEIDAVEFTGGMKPRPRDAPAVERAPTPEEERVARELRLRRERLQELEDEMGRLRAEIERLEAGR